MGNFPTDVTLNSQVIQNLILTANFAIGFRLGTGRNRAINNSTVDVIYSGTSSKPYIRLQDCRPY
jgi:hypothetical protein